MRSPPPDCGTETLTAALTKTPDAGRVALRKDVSRNAEAGPDLRVPPALSHLQSSQEPIPSLSRMSKTAASGRSQTLQMRTSIKTLSMMAALAAGGTPAAELTSVSTFATLPQPAPHAQVAYGTAQAQSIDVFVPAGSGPHPVAILVHGGCWSVRTAGREQLRRLGGELAERGIAAWSIGYRRANENGGGYPGTYQDVAAAIDLLRTEAPGRNFDLARSVLVGHSAGGHLALWAAARAHLPIDSPLRSLDPFVPTKVISLAGIGDLKAFAPLRAICGEDVADRLTPTRSALWGDAYADTSPASLPVPPARIWMISGIYDRLVPPHWAHDYLLTMQTKGRPDIELLNLPDAGHFDLVLPTTAAGSAIVRRIEQAVRE